MRRVAVLLILLLLPIGLIVWNHMFHPSGTTVMTAIIIWVAAGLWFLILLLEGVKERVDRQSKRLREHLKQQQT